MRDCLCFYTKVSRQNLSIFQAIFVYFVFFSKIFILFLLRLLREYGAENFQWQCVLFEEAISGLKVGSIFTLRQGGKPCHWGVLRGSWAPRGTWYSWAPFGLRNSLPLDVLALGHCWCGAVLWAMKGHMGDCWEGESVSFNMMGAIQNLSKDSASSHFYYYVSTFN